MSGEDAPGVVMAGGGLAAIAAARSLRAAGWAGGVRLYTSDHEPCYDRPPLSKQYLAGELGTDALALLGEGEKESLDIEVWTGCAATTVDTQARRLRLAGGDHIDYAACVVATGAVARRFPLDDSLAGIHYLRSRSDADALRESLHLARRVVVIGAGFIGLEVAATARRVGAEVTVLEAATTPLAGILGTDAGQAVAGLHTAHGVDLRCGVTVTGFEGAGRVEQVQVRAGDVVEALEADTVVIGIGAVPCVDWLTGSGIDVADGIVCDSGGRTSAGGVYAAGDASRWSNRALGTHQRMEHWQAAMEQGAIAGANIAADLGVPGAEPREWTTVPYFWSDQYEHKIQFCGVPGRIWRSQQTGRGWVACTAESEDGPLRGVLAIDGTAALAKGRRHVSAGRLWSEALEWLESL